MADTANIKGTSFIKRSLSGLILVILVVGSALLSGLAFTVMLMVVCGACMYEFYRLSAITGARPIVGYGIALGVLTMATTYLMSRYVELFEAYGQFAVGGLIFLLFIVSIIELFRKKDFPLANIASTVFGIMYIAIPLSMIIRIGFFNISSMNAGDMAGFSGKFHAWIILSYIFLVWANDVGAYIIGMLFGKHRLFERISPKKSWEGFFGGLMFALIVALVEAHFLGISRWFWIGLAIITVLGGVLGDLIESMFKRSAGIKDSGKIIPGHGGFLDRFDALIFSVPFVFVYFIIFAF